MDLAHLVQTIQSSAAGEWMRTSIKAMPIVESIHVLAAATLFGTILVVDLRLLGLPNTRRPFTRISHEMLRLTWGAFAVAVVAGALMFAANAHTYFINTAFRLKVLAILCAGINMAFFQFVTFRNVAAWDQNVRPPLPARLAGATSMLLWIAVICFARWIGFTKGYDFSVPAGAEINFKF
ncbi:MAG TPA: DUF6644 family protein [Steroidobacteraceae bacterium]|nr:DUF6644 family protein [Steroidobacteraceae bacterium]